MKTIQQRIFEAQIRRQLAYPKLAELDAAAQHEACKEERELNLIVRGVKARVDAGGQVLPKGVYRSAAEHSHAYGEAEFVRHNGFLSHRAGAVDGGPGLWRIVCGREGCERDFLTKFRHRRFCTEACARADQRTKADAKRARLEAVTQECAAPGCTTRIFPLRPDHRYCSGRCRDASRTRPRITHEARHCEACGEGFTPKNTRARFCSPKCRVRTWQRTQSDVSATTQPIPIQR